MEPKGDPTIYTYLHLCTINVKEKIVEMDTGKILALWRGDDYERPRGDQTLKADPSNCDLNGDWPKNCGEYARLWGKTIKGSDWAFPSIYEVVMGVYDHLMEQV